MRASRSFVIALVVWFAVAFGGWIGATAQTFQHPGILVSKAQLDYIKTMVQAHQEPFYSAFLKAQNNSGSLNYSIAAAKTGTSTGWANGVIECGPTSTPNYGCSNSDDDSTAAYEQALLWYITGNQQYATNAINILNYYAQNMKGYGPTATYSNTPLQAAWDAEKWPRAAEIIRYSNAGWPEAQAEAFGQWMNTYMLPQIINGSTSNGNWEISMIEGMINIAVYNDDVATFNQGITFWKQRIPAYFYYHTDGAQPVAAPRGTASWYGQTVYDASVDGISQETCRDFGHAQYGISGALDAAETAYIQGVNLYTDAASNAQNRLTAALEFNAYYLSGNPVPLSVCGGAVTLQVYPVDEIGYNEYHNRLGLSLPNTIQYLQSTIRQLSDPTEYHIMVYESLTHGGDASSLQPFLLYSGNTGATVVGGSSGTYTVQVIPGSNPNPAVTLSLSGLPSGSSYTFNPATVTGAGPTTLTINPASTTPAGPYALTVTGTAPGVNGGSASTFNLPLSLTINLPNSDFSISASPLTGSSVAGDVASFTTTFKAINSYTGNVTLSVSGLPTGASSSFSSNTIGNTSPTSVLNVTTLGSTAPGAYPITISATDGTNTHTTQVLLVITSINNACIQQIGNYWVSGAIPTQTGTFTAEWDATPSTSLNNSNVGLSLNLPASSTDFTALAIAGRFNPSGMIDGRNGGAFAAATNIPYTAGTSYHFRAVVNITAGTYSLYVTPAGQSEIQVGNNFAFRSEQTGITSLTHWNAISQVGSISLCNLVVDGPDFSLTSSPSSQSISAGNSARYITTFAALGGYTGSVTLSATGLPSGTTATFNPSTLGGSATTSTMTVTSTAAAPVGVYPLAVAATDGTITHTAYPELTIGAPCLGPTATGQTLSVQENSAIAATLSGTLGSGCSSTDALTYNVTVNPTHGVLTGTVPNLMYTPTTGFTGTDTFSFTATDANAVTPTSGASAVTITVVPPTAGAPILTSLTPNVVAAGSSATTLTIKGTGFTSGSTVLWNGSSRTTTYVSSTQVAAAITASDLVGAGLAAVTVSNPGASGGTSGALELAIDTGTSTSVTASSTVTITHGQSGQLPLTFSNLPAGTQTAVGCYNLPAGANCSYTASTKTVTVTTELNTPAGTYQVLVVSNSTPTQTASAKTESKGGVFFALIGLPFGLLCFSGRRRRWLLSVFAVLSVVLVLASGCASGTKPPQPPAITQASVTVTLTVN